MKEHLKIYIYYIEDVSKVSPEIVDEHNQKRQNSDISVAIGLIGKKRQITLNIPWLLIQNKDKMVRLKAIAIFKKKKSFNTLKDES